MELEGTVVIYSVVGVVVAVAMLLRPAPQLAASAWPAWVGCLAAIPFWPIYALLLLSSTASAPAGRPSLGPGRAEDPLRPRIDRLESRLVAAAGRLSGGAEEALRPELKRVRAVADALRRMVDRAAQMEGLLSSPEMDVVEARSRLTDLERAGVDGSDPRIRSLRSREDTIERLQAMRDQTRADAERVLLEIEETVCQLHLLQFAGPSDGEVLDRVCALTETVDELARGLFDDSTPPPWR